MRFIVNASDAVVEVAGRATPSARVGAAAIAVALGRVCAAAGVELELAFALARLAHAGDGRPARAVPDEEVYERVIQ